METVVGAGGYPLTPAQAQQVALARLVLADPHTLVLDEATSLLDPRAARHLERSLASVLRGRTVVAIAHRLHTAHDADRVAVVEAGPAVGGWNARRARAAPGLLRSPLGLLARRPLTNEDAPLVPGQRPLVERVDDRVGEEDVIRQVRFQPRHEKFLGQPLHGRGDIGAAAHEPRAFAELTLLDDMGRAQESSLADG